MTLLTKSKKPVPGSYIDDAVGCIGKLPLHVEFIRQHLGKFALSKLDDWIQQSFAAINDPRNRHLRTHFSAMPLYYCLLQLPDETLPVAGCLIASSDQSGREYPFIAFRQLQHPVALEFPTIIPILYEAFFQRANSFCTPARPGGTLQDLYSELVNLRGCVTNIARRTALEQTLTALQAITLQDYWVDLCDDFPQLTLPQFISEVLNTLQRCRQQLSHPAWTLRLPLMKRSSPFPYVVFWLQLLEKWLPAHYPPRQIFWNLSSSDKRTELYLFGDTLSSKQFIELIRTGTAVESSFQLNLNNLEATNCSLATKLAEYATHSLFKTLQLWSTPQLLEK